MTTRSGWTAGWAEALAERLAARRERGRLREIARLLLRHDDRLLEDAGFTRHLLEQALARPETFGGVAEIRRRAMAELRPPERPRAPTPRASPEARRVSAGCASPGSAAGCGGAC